MTAHDSEISPLLQYVTRLWRVLPEGNSLGSDEWARRHRGVVWLMWHHAIGLPACGLLTAHHVQLGFGGGIILKEGA